jgi:hypothetical protein
MPAPQVMPWIRPFAPSSMPRATRSAPPISQRMLAVDAADAAGALMRLPRLGDAAGDAVGHQLLMPLAPGAAV